MFKNIKYLGTLAIVGLPLYACSDGLTLEKSSDEYTISETGEKTPLEMAVTLQDSYAGPQTRALNGTFESGDKLIAYVEQVVKEDNDGDNVFSGSTSDAAKVSKLVTFTVGVAGQTVTADNLGVALYWDDFSNTTDDITKSDRWLRVGYGFCYNGGVPVENSVSSTNDEVRWKVQDNQTTESSADVRKSDLLWAGPQIAVQYDPTKVRPNVSDKVKLPVTYTHAMSKVTIELVLADGFEKDSDGKAVAFGTNKTTPVLYANKEAVEVNAKTQTLKATVAPSTDAGIQMYLSDDEKTTNGTRVYEAIIAPTVIKAGYKLVTVEVDGNKYDLVLTDELLKTPYTSSGASWASQLYGYTANDESKVVSKNTNDSQGSTDSPDGITASGINYRLRATLKKQRIEVEAKITDWTDVSASTNGIISFNADVKTSATSSGAEVLAGSFDLWRSTTNADHNSYDEITSTTDEIDKATTVSYADSKWSCTPAIYWPDGSTKYYFRALANYSEEGDTKVKTLSSVYGSVIANQGSDLVWGTTAAHKGTEADGTTTHNYDEGEAINPRTGNVPLTFEHAMSKISVILKNEDGIPPAAQVDLSGAKISIINLYDEGRINIKTGNIDDKFGPVDYDNTENKKDHRTIIDSPVNAEFKWLDNIVIPQKLDKDKNGATRDIKPSYYNWNELTAIYDNGMSIGIGTPTYYLTSELTTIDAITYTEETAETHNATLPGAWNSETVKTPLIPATYYQSVEEFNADHANKSDRFTLEEFNKMPIEAKGGKTYSDFKDLESITEEMFIYIPDNLKIKTEEVPATYYTPDEILAHNASLPGAVKAGDVATAGCYKLPENKSLTPHNPGDVKDPGNKIILYVTLADGTIYSIDLAQIDTEDGPEWKRGKHYKYTISLAKENITFRALIEKWNDVEGGGKATLDWD